MLFEDIWKIISNKDLMGYVFSGFGNTLLITLLAAAMGLVIGLVVAIVKIAAEEYKIMKIPAAIFNIYTTVIRGTPVALQLFIMVFALLAIPGMKPTAAVLTFGINSGAYVSENIRAGISSVDKGQMEAGRALGLSWVKTMTKIIIPQAVKNILPAVGNEMIALLKETSIIQLIGSTPGTLTFDLNYAATTIYKTVTNYLACYLIVGAFYLGVVYLMVIIVKYMEKRLKASDKR
ncbi:MAG: amino acid ABC transporter permease [Clostridia bacterium]|nr:amino acid ABC transporter permease [Clostridia bacterium]